MRQRCFDFAMILKKNIMLNIESACLIFKCNHKSVSMKRCLFPCRTSALLSQGRVLLRDLFFLIL